MPYIGKQPTVGNFQVCDAIAVVNGQAAYTLQVGGVNVAPESANHMLVSLNGILQKPGSSFTISGSTMTFASNLATGDVIDFVQILGNVLDIGQPSDDTVTAAKLNDNVISGQTELAATPADTDEFLVSDAGTLKRVDYSHIKSTPGLVKLQTQTASSSSSITFTSTYITTTYKKYYLDYTNVTISSDGGNIAATVSYDNGSSYVTAGIYKYVRYYSNTDLSNNSIVSGAGTTNTSLLMLGTGNGLGTSTDESGSGRMTIFDPNSADSKFFLCEGMIIDSGGKLSQQKIYQALITSNTINNIKIEPNTGTIETGTFTLYGVTT